MAEEEAAGEGDNAFGGVLRQKRRIVPDASGIAKEGDAGEQTQALLDAYFGSNDPLPEDERFLKSYIAQQVHAFWVVCRWTCTTDFWDNLSKRQGTIDRLVTCRAGLTEVTSLAASLRMTLMRMRNIWRQQSGLSLSTTIALRSDLVALCLMGAYTLGPAQYGKEGRRCRCLQEVHCCMLLRRSRGPQV